jgi:phosphoribosylaminoimidazole-succinocarboxamide synthase
MNTTEIPENREPDPLLGLGSSAGLGVNRADFECEWTPTEKDDKLRELALRYHAKTEAYDRTVCTGPIVDGSIQPFGPRQAALINRNANKVFQQIKEEAARHGIDFAEMWRAIGRHA